MTFSGCLSFVAGSYECHEMGELIMPQLRIKLNDVSIDPLAQVQSTSISIGSAR